MLCTVASMLTTTPRFKPLVAATPRPASRSSPPATISPTTTITLWVPMSSPTTRSLYSLAIQFLRGAVAGEAMVTLRNRTA